MATYCTAVGSRALAQAALDNQLYDNGGHLLHTLSAIANGDQSVITIAAVSGHPVGVCVIDGGIIQVYVRPEHRGRLIGSRLVEISKARWGGEDRQLGARLGVDTVRSLNFWRKNKVDVTNLCRELNGGELRRRKVACKLKWDQLHESEAV